MAVDPQAGENPFDSPRTGSSFDVPESMKTSKFGMWMALTAALLGWMFDGLEMGLFSLVARPALRDLLGPEATDATIGLWISVAVAGFLVGAATGGVLFGWLGDRLGRVRAMMLSVLTYSVFSSLCGFSTSAEQIAVFRFIAALGMGGEWALGVALIMEIWPDRSRGFLAGLIGAAANVGYLLIAVVGLGLSTWITELKDVFLSVGMNESWAESLTAHSGWRTLMIIGAFPALLTFFIRLFVPESKKWEEEHGRGTTSNWAIRDLLGVLIGAVAACTMIYLWAAKDISTTVRLVGTAVAMIITTFGYLYPVTRYLQRSAADGSMSNEQTRGIVRRMMLGACLGGVALLGTWGSLQWAPAWADQLTDGKMPEAKAYTQIWASIGAIIGTMTAALMGGWFGRRITYTLLCVASLASALLLFQGSTEYGPFFLFAVFLAGGCTASFYGWLPLYLPELFGTRVRATGQGFSFNYGRMLATVGVLQTGNLMGYFDGSYPKACSVMSLIYIVGMGIIWLAPETKGKPLPD